MAIKFYPNFLYFKCKYLYASLKIILNILTKISIYSKAIIIPKNDLAV